MSITMKKLAALAPTEAPEYKVRLDPVLASTVHAHVQLSYPAVRVGKRFSIEFVLRRWLADHGYNDDLKLPGDGPCTL